MTKLELKDSLESLSENFGTKEETKLCYLCKNVISGVLAIHFSKVLQDDGIQEVFKRYIPEIVSNIYNNSKLYYISMLTVTNI